MTANMMIIDPLQGLHPFRWMNLLCYHLRTIWLFTVSDHFTFVLPESLFGLIGALSGSALTTNATPTVSTAFRRLPYVVLWTWLNTFVFTLSNQGDAQAIAEDKLNKPWRPLPAARITLVQTRHLLTFAALTVLVITYFFLGGFEETTALFFLTWLYNDMGGANKSFIVRNLIIAIAYAFYGSGALRVAVAWPRHTESPQALVWMIIIALVIFTTMSIQDLKDQKGDSERRRRTAPLVLGETNTRYGIAAAVAAWSWICPAYWEAHFYAFALCVILGLVVASRVIQLRDQRSDRLSWQLWSLWLIFMYFLPLCREDQNTGSNSGTYLGCQVDDILDFLQSISRSDRYCSGSGLLKSSDWIWHLSI
ncbi:MAG: hypothetical protein Q9159_000913 [Coniocarpon cinnabarinum]